MSKSIYQILCDNITDDTLARDFSLDANSTTDEPGWAPGAWDGVLIYHLGSNPMDAADTKAMAQALNAANRRDFKKADELFAAFCEKNKAVLIIDTLQNYIIKHQKKLIPNNMHAAALNLILTSENIESVKIGLEILELLEEPSEDIKKIVRRLGLYDEFTIFAVWNMQKWSNGNEEIFRLAQKCTSWGRIHAVERLEPDTEEIRHWLLTEGSINGVLNSYSSLTCWQKSGAEGLLSAPVSDTDARFFAPVSDEEYEGLCTLIDGLLDEGPVPGISALENAEEILLQFLKLSENYELTWERYDTINEIKAWAEYNSAPAIIGLCEEFLSSPNCTEAVSAAVKEGKALSLAEERSIPFLDSLYDCMTRDFDEHFYQCHYLMDSPEYREKVIELFRSRLPLAEMTGAQKGSLPVGDDFEKYNQLDQMVQELVFYPMTGIDFIAAGVQGPYSRNRNMAIRCLKSWVQETGKPLQVLSPELFAAAKAAARSEEDEERAEDLSLLLKGETDFREDFEFLSEESEDEDDE